MKILVFNSGSSSLKYKLYDMPGEEELAGGLVERIGGGNGPARQHHRVGKGESWTRAVACADQPAALEYALEALADPRHPALADPAEVAVCGHRMVHGRDIFLGPVLVGPEVRARLGELADIAPLHMPHSIACLEAATRRLPAAAQVAHFDTCFHQSMPPHAHLYAVPWEWRERYHVRRYGFHGISHEYVTREAARLLGREPAELRLITAHLGNGSSVTAFNRGRVEDTSMGFTPLEGLMMGTRPGYLDPAVIPHLCRHAGLSVEEILDSLNKESGLLAISGFSRDMRAIVQAMEDGHARARLAFDMFIHNLKKYLGGYFFLLGGADAVVLTGGIGENSPQVREAAFADLGPWGLELDPERNQNLAPGSAGEISRPGSRVAIWVIPTNEELLIARAAAEVVGEA